MEPLATRNDDWMQADRQAESDGTDPGVADDETGFRDPFLEFREREIVERHGTSRSNSRGAVLEDDRLASRRKSVRGLDEAIERQVRRTDGYQDHGGEKKMLPA